LQVDSGESLQVLGDVDVQLLLLEGGDGYAVRKFERLGRVFVMSLLGFCFLGDYMLFGWRLNFCW
jgi:hypothetical protein